MAVTAADETDQNSGRSERRACEKPILTLLRGAASRILRCAGLLWRFFRNGREAGSSSAQRFVAGHRRHEIFRVKLSLCLEEFLHRDGEVLALGLAHERFDVLIGRVLVTLEFHLAAPQMGV